MTVFSNVSLKGEKEQHGTVTATLLKFGNMHSVKKNRLIMSGLGRAITRCCSLRVCRTQRIFCREHVGEAIYIFMHMDINIDRVVPSKIRDIASMHRKYDQAKKGF